MIRFTISNFYLMIYVEKKLSVELDITVLIKKKYFSELHRSR